MADCKDDGKGLTGITHVSQIVCKFTRKIAEKINDVKWFNMTKDLAL